MSATRLLRRMTGSKSAITLLKDDHEKVKKLFARFEKASESEDLAEAKRLVDEAIKDLKIHTELEEEMFYPALRREMKDEDGLLEEADEEHHAAKLLIAELELMRGDEENYCAKFEVLAENVRHHIKEEEGPLFRLAKRSDIDFEALGERMRARKEELQSQGVPDGDEARMIRGAGLPGESPSKKAAQGLEVPMSDARRGHARGRARAVVVAASLAAGAAASRAAAPAPPAASDQSGAATGSAASDIGTPSSNIGAPAPNAPAGTAGTGTNGTQDSMTPPPVNQAPGLTPAAPPFPSGTSNMGTTPGALGGGTGSLGTGLGTGTGTGTLGAGAPGTAAPSDDVAIRVRQSILQGSPATGGVSNLQVRSSPAGRLTITGVVHSQAEKDNIQAKAAAFVGFQNVDNQIIVR